MSEVDESGAEDDTPSGFDPFHLVAAWRRAGKARSARWLLLRLLPRISTPLCVAAGAIVLVAVTLSTASTIFTGVLVGAVPGAVEGGFDSPAGGRLIMALVIVGALFMTNQIIGPVQSLVVSTLSRRVNKHLQQRVMRASLAPTGIAHLEDPELLDKVRDASGVGEGQFTPGGAVGGIISGAHTRLGTLVAAVIVAQFKWWLAVLLVAFGVLVRYRLVADMLTTAKSGTGQTKVLRRSDYFRTVALIPESAKETRVFGLGPWILDRFREQWLAGMAVLWQERKERTATSWTWSLPWGALIGLSWFVLGRAGLQGEVGITELAIVGQAILSAGTIYLSGDDMAMAYGATAVPSVMALEAATTSPALALSGDDDPAGLPQRELRLEGVSFHYPGRDADVLSSLDLVIPAGRSLAIVGVNGAGKTTLVKLLARFYDPTEGRITADGVDIARFDPAKWQGRVAAIFQDFVRYELSAAANVGFGAVGQMHDRAALERAAGRAGAKSAIEALANGWDTVLSREYTDGAELSGGQWQRVALARALFAVQGGAGVLILDEPTANLDVRAEAELFERFLELTHGVTTVLISHRFSSVRHADQICVLEHGRIAEMGTHAELLGAGGRYAEMYSLQASRFTDDPALETTA